MKAFIKKKTSKIKIKIGKKCIYNACFVAGTLVNTQNGLIPIEQIKAGDLVYSKDEVTGQYGLKKVEATSITKTYITYNIRMGDEVISTTKEHQFFVHGKGYRQVKDLEVCDTIVSYSNGAFENKYIEITDIQRVLNTEQVEVYNFVVEDWHSYFVGNNNILVHNDAPYTAAVKKVKAKPYSNIPDSPSVGPGKKFTKTQKDKIIQENVNKNGGVVKSDLSGKELTKPQKSQQGVKPDPNEWQVDHIEPRSKGGSNSNNNAQVLSREENRIKWDK